MVDVEAWVEEFGGLGHEAVDVAAFDLGAVAEGVGEEGEGDLRGWEGEVGFYVVVILAFEVSGF